MATVAKYNIYKALSTVLTFGTPIGTVIACGDFYKNDGAACISVAAVLAFLLSALFLKDKLAENFKSPTPLKISLVGLIFCFVVKSIIESMQLVFGLTLAACLIDEISFKRLYTQTELGLPAAAQSFKHVGFVLTSSKALGIEKVKENKLNG